MKFICNFSKQTVVITVVSYCGSVGRAVAFETRNLRFKCNHGHILFTNNVIEKMNLNKKRHEMAHLLAALSCLMLMSPHESVSYR